MWSTTGSGSHAVCLLIMRIPCVSKIESGSERPWIRCRCLGNGGFPGFGRLLARRETDEPESTMLNWTITFFILALIMGVLGVSGLAGAAVGIAQTLFALFFGLAIMSLLVDEQRRRHF